MLNCIIDKNESEEVTGGILINKLKHIEIKNTRFTENYAISGGGALKV